MENNFPCVCGHSRINHTSCVCRSSDNHMQYQCSVIDCPCAEFKADNLRWLEKQYGSEQ